MAPRHNTLYNCDCIAGLNKLAARTVDLAFADPPFNVGYDYDVYKAVLASERYLAWSRDWTAEFVRVRGTRRTRSRRAAAEDQQSLPHF